MEETDTEEELEKKRVRTLVRKGIAVKYFRKDTMSGGATARKLVNDEENVDPNTI